MKTSSTEMVTVINVDANGRKVLVRMPKNQASKLRKVSSANPRVAKAVLG